MYHNIKQYCSIRHTVLYLIIYLLSAKMKSTHSITIDDQIWNDIVKIAQKDRRSTSNLIQMLIEKHINDIKRKKITTYPLSDNK